MTDRNPLVDPQPGDTVVATTPASYTIPAGTLYQVSTDGGKTWAWYRMPTDRTFVGDPKEQHKDTFTFERPDYLLRVNLGQLKIQGAK